MATTVMDTATGMDVRRNRARNLRASGPGRPRRLGAVCVAGLVLSCAGWASAQSAGTGVGTGGGSRSLTVVPGVRTSVAVSDSQLDTAARGTSYLFEVSPYIDATMSNARTQGTLSYSMRNFSSHAPDGNDTYTRHDLRATLNSLLIGDWFGVQGSAAIYNTNASLAGGLSADPAASRSNNAALRMMSISPYVQGRYGGFASYRAQYRYDQTSTTDNVMAGLATGSHQVTLNVTGGPSFNPWGWAVTSTGSRREFSNNVNLQSASTVATLFFTPSSELRLGASLNYLYIERFANSDGQSNGWGPGVSVDWSPSRRTTVRGSITKQYYGTSESLALAHRTTRFIFGLDYGRSVLQSNNAALLTFNPGSVFSGGGFSPALNPLFTQLADQGLLSSNDVVLGTNVINDALVRNRTLTASVGYLMPRWSATASAFRSVRETVFSSEVFGVANGLSPASFGLFTTRGFTLTSNYTIDSRNSVNLSATLRDSDIAATAAGAPATKVRLSYYQAALNTRIDSRSSASLMLRRTVQSGDGIGPGNRDNNAIIGTYDIRLR
jgi:uncharacterized protein (PEP-CTERM system associated)